MGLPRGGLQGSWLVTYRLATYRNGRWRLKTAEEGAAAMSSMEMDPPDGQSADPETAVGTEPHVSFWIRELPFSLVLILTLLGVAYTSLLKQPIMVYWELLAPVIGLVCVSSGWSTRQRQNRANTIDSDAGAALGGVPARDEYDPVA